MSCRRSRPGPRRRQSRDCVAWNPKITKESFLKYTDPSFIPTSSDRDSLEKVDWRPSNNPATASRPSANPSSPSNSGSIPSRHRPSTLSSGCLDHRPI